MLRICLGHRAEGKTRGDVLQKCPWPVTASGLRCSALSEFRLPSSCTAAWAPALRVARARPARFSGLFPIVPIVFLVSALASGGALLTFLVANRSRLAPNRKAALTKDLARMSLQTLCFDFFAAHVRDARGLETGPCRTRPPPGA
ncbi:MAG: hypothetical protein KatS3mg077_0547 [Candidatus Binatia bacterium]|nr:MAG: hypothetical protein KatS3mg077_0547 [Candidatus Binatia bacterium]